MRNCDIPGCPNPHLARGLCNRHYQTQRRHGRPDGRATFRRDEFVALCAIETTECVLWPHNLTHDGYGRVRWEGVKRYVNVLACERAHGPQPEGYEAAHSCGVRNCVNARHLRWDTHAGNEADKRTHGTSPAGERNARSRLTWVAVDEIRSRVGASRRELAAEFDVSIATIQHVQSGRTWKETSR